MAHLRHLRASGHLAKSFQPSFRPPTTNHARRRYLSLSTTTPSPPIFHDVAPLRAHRRSLLLRNPNQTIALVPTMGALHAGHLSLVRLAATENAHVFLSIYLNPTQFAPTEDLTSYPQTWPADMAALAALDADLAATPGAGRIAAVFAPSTKTMYPTAPPDSTIPGVGSFVEMRPLGQVLEGASRPVFFRGVATVCLKLFNICAPHRVYFGQKDIQQTIVMKRLVKDFHLDMDVRVGPTAREKDGLALSSRNVYLGARRRAVGIVLYQALRRAEAQYKAGKRRRGDILWPADALADETLLAQEALDPGQRARFEVDYISLADPETMEEVDEVDEARGAILSGAVKMLPVEEPREGEDLGLGGGQIPVRLIDNIVLDAAV